MLRLGLGIWIFALRNTICSFRRKSARWTVCTTAAEKQLQLQHELPKILVRAPLESLGRFICGHWSTMTGPAVVRARARGLRDTCSCHRTWRSRSCRPTRRPNIAIQNTANLDTIFCHISCNFSDRWISYTSTRTNGLIKRAHTFTATSTQTPRTEAKGTNYFLTV